MKKIYRNVALVLWCVPYSFLGLYCDKYYRNIVMYAAAVIAPLLLAGFMHKMGYKHSITVFSIINIIICETLSSLYLAEVSYYFKPLNNTILTFVLWAIPFMSNFFVYKLYDLDIKKQGD